MDDTTYNGWTNRDTWLVSLWLNNQEYTYKALRNAAGTGATQRGGASHMPLPAIRPRIVIKPMTIVGLSVVGWVGWWFR